MDARFTLIRVLALPHEVVVGRDLVNLWLELSSTFASRSCSGGDGEDAGAAEDEVLERNHFEVEMYLVGWLAVCWWMS